MSLGEDEEEFHLKVKYVSFVSTAVNRLEKGSAQSFVSFCDIFFFNYYIFFQNVHKGEGFVKTSSNLPQFHTPRNTRHYVSPVQLLNLQSLHSSVLLSEWLNVYTGCKKKKNPCFLTSAHCT